MVPIIFIILVLGGFGVSGYVNAFTPEDTSFAVERCANLSSADTDLRLKWAYWKFPDKKETHCFIKCVLEKLGLINLITRGLDHNKISDQIGEDDLIMVPETDFWESVVEELSGTCKSYYLKWISLIDRYPQVMRRIFFATAKDVKDFYRPYGAKRKGMSAIDFCVSTTPGENDNRYNTVEGNEEYPCYWECVFKHFRYFDAYGRIDRNEVIGSFRNSCNCSLEDEVNAINSCVHQSNQDYPYGLCQMANTLYKCLASQTTHTLEVFIKRNLWTTTY